MDKTLFKFFLYIILAATTAALPACSDSDDGPANAGSDGTGITSPSWNGEVNASAEGETIKFTFHASDAWTAVSDQSWCVISPARGRDGRSELFATVSANASTEARTARIVIRVAATPKSAVITVVQAAKGSSANVSDVNHWMFDYMKRNYLWNEPLADFKPNYSLGCEPFLTSMLNAVDADNHRNRDDGHWENGKRQYYYSFIESSAAAKSSPARSRSVGESETGSGVTYMIATMGQENNVELLPAMVAPGTPADKAGIKRGTVVIKVNGKAINESNYNNLANTLYNGNCKVTVADISGGKYINQKEVSVGSATYTDPAIYKSSVYTLQSGRKVGYLAYMGFEMDYDSQLIDVFSQFKANGVTDLVLDLRYNGGGHVLSSVVLGTLCSGPSNKGKLYNRTTYNAARSAKGEVGDYHLGLAANPESPSGYKKIADALTASLDLNTIYVITTVNTASASELVINGLRGVDVTVNTIGTTTNGKNVGMEAIGRTFGSTEYLFAPITFYSQNAKGFRDYSDGFTPDLEIDEDNYYFGDFGSEDDILCRYAYKWIENGSKPALSRAGISDNTVRRLKLAANDNRSLVHNRGSIVIREAEPLR